MKLIYCSEPFSPTRVDSAYEREAEAANAAGPGYELIDFEALVDGRKPVAAVRKVKAVSNRELAVYRGWMLKPGIYAQLYEVLREKGLFRDLTTAFGRNGIQAMLIETAIPEIQDEANRLLAQMTSGRMHVELKTQRERASGEGQIETLDVVIHDNLGSRPYEMYSGGEAFRVNFALRIALSRLLAQRAGAKLETLVIDEGFGSQDQEGRDRLVEAIKSVEDEFAMILVITHLDDLKERFPVRIDVQKRPDGSVLHTEWVA